MNMFFLANFAGSHFFLKWCLFFFFNSVFNQFQQPPAEVSLLWILPRMDFNCYFPPISDVYISSLIFFKWILPVHPTASQSLPSNTSVTIAMCSIQRNFSINICWLTLRKFKNYRELCWHNWFLKRYISNLISKEKLNKLRLEI